MNLVEILTELRIDFKRAGEHHHVRGAWFGLDCPTCSPGEQSYKLGITETGACSCWSCGSMPLTNTLAAISGKHWKDVKKLLSGLTRQHDIPLEHPVAGKVKLPAGLGPLLPIHRKYLKGRDFDPDQLERVWKVQGIGLSARFAWRIFIPVHYRGEIVSWTTRATTDNVTLRYIHASPAEEKIRAKELLFGGDFVRHASIIVEGHLDAIAIGPGAAATAGLGYTQAQLLRISKIPIRAICFDNEPDAQRRAQALARALEPYSGKTYQVHLDSGKDPGEASTKEIKQLRRAFLD